MSFSELTAHLRLTFTLFACLLLLGGCNSSIELTNTSDAFAFAFTTSTLRYSENGVLVTANVSLAEEAPETISIPYSVASADPSNRCVAAGGTLVFAPGELAKTIDVCTLANNSTYEGDSSLTLQLGTPSLGLVGTPATVEITIAEDDPRPAFTFAVATATKAESDGTPLTVTVNLNTAYSSSLTVPITFGGTATKGTDYNVSPDLTTLTFAAGETSKAFTLTIVNEGTNLISDEEADETIVLGFGDLFPAQAGTQSTETVTITDDDRPSLSIADILAADGSAAAFVVALSRASTRNVSFVYTTGDVSASSGTDYTGSNGSATIASGSTSTIVSIPVLRKDNSSGKQFSLTVASITNSSTTSATGTATIDNSTLYVPFVTTAFSSSLTPLGTLKPVRPSSGVAPAFARAGPALIADFEGVLHTALPDEARFQGLRRVENLATASIDFEDAAWTAGTGLIVSATTVTAPNSFGNIGSRIEYDASGAANQSHLSQSYASAVSGRQYVYSMWMRTGHSGGLSVKLGLGSSTATIAITGDNTWRRYAVGATAAASGALVFGLRDAGSNADFDDLEIFGAQLEDVTGQALQLAAPGGRLIPSEFVSTGLLTAPLFHGAGIDSVKYFGYANGNGVNASQQVSEATGLPFSSLPGLVLEGAATNVLLSSTAFDVSAWTASGGALSAASTAVSPNGAVSGALLTDNSTGSLAKVCQSTTVTNDSKAWTLSVYVKKDAAANASFGLTAALSGGTAVSGDVRLNLTNGSSSLVSGTAATVADAGGFYRVALTVANNGTGNTTLTSCLVPADGPNGVTDSSQAAGVTGTAIVWGAQLEVGLFASSFIETTGIAVSRAAESLSYDPPVGFSLSSPYTVSINAALLGVVSDAACATGDNCQVAIGSDSTAAPYLRLASGTANSSVAFNSDSSLASAALVSVADTARKTPAYYVGRNDGTRNDVFAAGAKGTSSNLGTAAAAPTAIYVGGTAAGDHLFGVVKHLEIWTRALSDTEAAAVHGY